MSDEDRFWSKVSIGDSNECWNWLASTSTGGYGQFSIYYDKRKYNLIAHRYAYELLVGEIPEDLVIDHKCRNKLCVNPNHLEPVTVLENTIRGLAGFHWRVKTHCPRGHEYNESNTYIRHTTDRRGCRECHRLQELNKRKRIKKELANIQSTIDIILKHLKLNAK